MEENQVPVLPAYSPSRRPPLLPLLFGFLIVVIVAAASGIAYYKSKLTTATQSSPTPSPVATIATSTPSPESVATGSSPTVKPTVKPTSTPTKTPNPSPTATPVAQPTLDIRFANPSAYIKQTIDEGTGDGRVINREYSSIQVGQFDEVKSAWSPKVTACFNIVSNQDVKGGDVKFRLTLNDKLDLEGDLGQYDKLETGKSYVWCHDLTTDIGKFTARLELNHGKNLKEWNYNNNLGRIDYENLADKIAPNFTLGGPYDWGSTRGTCFQIISPSDNVTETSKLKIEQKTNNDAYASTNLGEFCFMGAKGDPHSYAVKVTDERGNVNEQSKTFVLY